MTGGATGQRCHHDGSVVEENGHEDSKSRFDKRGLARIVVNAAIASTADQQDLSSEVPSSADSKSTAWLALSTALTKATGNAQSSTATSLSDPSLSEVSSSHGGISPRESSQAIDAAPENSKDFAFRPAVAMRWADELEAENEDDFLHFCPDGTKPSFEQEEIEGTDAVTPSKRSRRSNRRRRARAEKGAAMEIHESTASRGPSSAKTGRGLRDSVTVGDLFGHDSTASQAPLMRTPQRREQTDEMTWYMPMSPCQVQSSSMGVVSTSPCGGKAFHGEASMRIASGYPHHPVGMLAAHSPCLPQAFAPQVHSPYAETVPRSPCNTRAGPNGIVSTSPLTPIGAQANEASSRPQPPLLDLSSPCHSMSAVSGGIISTAPPSHCQLGTLPACSSPTSWPGPQSTSTEVRTLEPAGSPTADALRSWLHASGLPSCADLAWQLQAVAPETYED